MRPILAEFDSTCAICMRRIYQGDEIVRLAEEDEWAHADCAEDEGEAVDR